VTALTAWPDPSTRVDLPPPARGALRRPRDTAHRNNTVRWTEYDDLALITLVRRGATASVCSVALGCSERAVRIRAVLLGLSWKGPR
jgi:hypothetical protein